MKGTGVLLFLVVGIIIPYEIYGQGSLAATLQSTSDAPSLIDAAPNPSRPVTSEQSRPVFVTTSGNKVNRVTDFTKSFMVGTSCSDVQIQQGAKESGTYLIHPPNLIQGPWKVFCDMEDNGGGWTVFQVRDDVTPRENFQRNWEDYKVGFGSFDLEFWLGNILVWALTNYDNSTLNDLHVEMEDWSGNKRFAIYRGFSIGPENDYYRLHHNNVFIGNAGDSLNSHNGRPFSTFDDDNDKLGERNCAALYKGGWWYGNCHDSNLNGLSHHGHHSSFADGINWYAWTGYNYSLKRTVMKFRPSSKDPISDLLRNLIIGNKGRSSHQTEDMTADDDPSAQLMSSINRLTRPSLEEL